jgi:hypothetical protein
VRASEQAGQGLRLPDSDLIGLLVIVEQTHLPAAPAHEAIEGIRQGVLVGLAVELSQLLSCLLESLDDGRSFLTLGG